VLVFALLESKMSQPRNFLGGQMLSALVGITVRVIIPKVWIAGPVGMSLALLAMQLTATTHPPGGPGQRRSLSEANLLFALICASIDVVSVQPCPVGRPSPIASIACPRRLAAWPPPPSRSRSPPLAAGGATALIACTMSTLPKWHGYSYLVTIAVGSVIMQIIALVVNNIDPRRRYPTFWW
jgi:CBS-domain-containing membrane protein